ncbi:hypothetical protein ETD86_19465 [Nonomuraea turkmeniaca]|uniref:Uncharacterized protein n=1 Tax=Nonomuraea turkmeniaca TaxID=103838 RepID=A0A5S4FHR9_9ACTN|nr:hypothetical protein [Nonomuraea turkmeniaca]TMR19925.1 hypothetical protein ETD86_19465 [Nonomuraea turkmeniaca]
MTRSAPILTLLMGMVTTVALAVLSIAMAPAPRPVADGTTTAATREDPAAGGRTPAPQAPAEEPSEIPAAKADYAGRVQGSRGLFAISVRGDKAIAYFCDGKTEAWFQGTASDGELLLEGFGGAGVVAEVAGFKVTGEVQIGAQRWEFTAPTVRRPSGLYRATALVRGAKLVAGWIYLPDGRRVGAVTLDGNLITAEVPEPGEPTVIKGKRIDPQDVDEFIGAL